ncbi:nicotinate-nucleotide adenylyltransferase [Rubrobacter taiwanensis]|uniref:Probable nicotinate-nucleotide adenylyltransferase n=1 Tax=Rubrobacter taiwanensis TaxID=185139 RepID=A0A4R1BJ43_9ACTN|nr:nicotinate-nucleotide adenylyltransferase [Rubrobacter taiwanensis]TCJ17326.1 nicotinate-nucleotide adenylyltransferase [Rubrobacter taiwanensis]
MRVGIFGGTFDPVHVGHLIIAEQVSDALGLERVLFVPSGMPPHKAAESVQAGAWDRLEMVREAVRGNPRFVVESLEVEAGGPMYSVDTTIALKEKYGDGEWYFISGADAVCDLLTWKDPDRLLEEAVMVAATRPGYDLSALNHLAEELRNFHRILPVECSRIDISSTEIRSRRARGRSIRYMVPEPVYRIIEKRGIYSLEERVERSESLNRSQIP